MSAWSTISDIVRRRFSSTVVPAIALAVCALTAAPAAAQRESAPSERMTARDRADFEELARKIEPDLTGHPERLAQYVDLFRREMVNDPRLFAFQVGAKTSDHGAVVLDGYVEFEETRHDLLFFFQTLGFDTIVDRIEILPSEHLGGERFGLVVAPHSPCFDRPSRQGGVVTECLLAEPVFLLKQTAGGFYLCHTAEGYLGFVAAKDVKRVAAKAFLRYQAGSHGTMLRDVTTSADQLLPAGARLRWVGGDSTLVRLALPDGEQIVVPADSCQQRGGGTNPRVERAIDNGMRLMGTKYLWGGKTSRGIDCSGLVQIAFAAEGIHLPRDSNQQVYLGRLTATRWFTGGLQRGDTMYFLGRRGKITHTAIYLGAGRYLQSAGPGVHISSINPVDQNFDAARAKRFAFAKRLLD